MKEKSGLSPEEIERSIGLLKQYEGQDLDSRELFDEEIKDHNLRLIQDIINHNDESIGGNATSELIDGVRYPCVAFNGYLDQDNGKIKSFTNKDESFSDSYTHFTLRIAIVSNWFRSKDLKPKNKEDVTVENRIVRVYIDGEISDKARKNIDDTVTKWNERQKSKIK